VRSPTRRNRPSALGELERDVGVDPGPPGVLGEHPPVLDEPELAVEGKRGGVDVGDGLQEVLGVLRDRGSAR